MLTAALQVLGVGMEEMCYTSYLAMITINGLPTTALDINNYETDNLVKAVYTTLE